MARFLLLLTLVSASSCQLWGPDYSREQSQLDACRARWAAAHLTNYDYEYAPDPGQVDWRSRWRVHVVGGEVASVENLVAGGPGPLPGQRFYTIPQLFKKLQWGIDLPAYTLSAHYDPASPVPLDMGYDPDRHWADDQWGITIENFVAR